MSDDDWGAGFAKSVAVYLDGGAIPDVDRRGDRLTDDCFLLVFNASDDMIEWTLPPAIGSGWRMIVDTASEGDLGIGSGRDLQGDRPKHDRVEAGVRRFRERCGTRRT